MEIKYIEASLGDIFDFWMKAYELPKDTHIYRWEWFINPDTKRVVFKVYVADGPDPLKL